LFPRELDEDFIGILVAELLCRMMGKRESNACPFTGLALDLEYTIDTFGTLLHDIQAIVIDSLVFAGCVIHTDTIVFDQDVTLTLRVAAQNDTYSMCLAMLAYVVQGFLDNT
jgi:hypothetical protein